MINYFVWNFKCYPWNSTQNIIPICGKMGLLCNLENLRALMFKNSYVLFKCPPLSSKWMQTCQVIKLDFSKLSIITCQNLHFGKYVRLKVCLFVCGWVCKVDDTGRTVRAINTKLGTYMYLGSGYRYIVFGVDDIIDDVIRSKNKSNFEIVVTQSIFKLERRSKAQNVGHVLGFPDKVLNFRWHFRRKSSPQP